MDRFNRHMGRFALNLAMVLFSLLALFPLCWVALTAFQPTDQGVSFVLADILAKKPTLQNFVRVSELIPMAQNFWNSVVVSVVGTLLTLFFCALAGYALSLIHILSLWYPTRRPMSRKSRRILRPGKAVSRGGAPSALFAKSAFCPVPGLVLAKKRLCHLLLFRWAVIV